MREVVRQNSSDRVEFYYEFQDNLRIPNEKYDAEMAEFLKSKYAGEKIDLLVGFGSPAVDFLLKHERSYLPVYQNSSTSMTHLNPKFKVYGGLQRGNFRLTN
jgi:hypothetical protein